MVLGAYSRPIVICGSLMALINWLDGFPKRTTAAKWLATSGGVGWGGWARFAPSGTWFAVTKPVTAAPWEYPPSTILVLGQVAAMCSTWLPASVIVDGCREIGGGRVVDRISPQRFRADVRAQRVDEILTYAANAGWLGGAAGEHHLDVGARLSRGGWDWCDQQRPKRRYRSTNETSDGMSLHTAFLSHRDNGRALSVRRLRPRSIRLGAPWARAAADIPRSSP
jgi:hypothetical protein